ncbi:MAG: rRNA maturation RNase YbeY [Chlorobium sp.]|jgi:probable rRNA maturation factor|uniref:rRNA maturation RNase YbeY n=1 Tax=Chlorobium sp. TaxID=1095 RepID=UPI001E0C2FCC|nr:rRNA maturation RNase YbeY [Chlorobium sp.]MBN1279186.1 rRNA maturation RNase YbeY [Chlorobiaceae bacterium]MCF8216391.1 rRNA maturation RNase YbeY [Chlorobium sp.]MCF8271294.1 rRNA maturation RNase YbeY [Chlorobium sp.]MCF8287668.1 rRNA maturation RNase YbeY [Chlorobium sp.]MCF8291205.1 rRNA maturation RNase YbeY [Chlorobium sp.]
MPVQIFNTTRKPLPEELLVRTVETVLEAEGFGIENIVAVYCGRKMIRRINREFLQHDYATDTITFRYNDGSDVDGEFYISLDVIEENAGRFGTDVRQELLRVTIHSALHLIGFDDETPEARKVMQEKEEFYLFHLPVTENKKNDNHA